MLMLRFELAVLAWASCRAMTAAIVTINLILNINEDAVVIGNVLESYLQWPELVM